jgi:nucleoside-diphosphate-sugar epimerase
VLDEPDQIVVTGAAGWFGTALCRQLMRDRTRPPRALVTSDDDAARLRTIAGNVDIEVGDVTDPEVCQRLLAGTRGAAVIHAAAVIHPNRTDEFERVNVHGTATLAHAAATAQAARFVLLSSAAAVGVNSHETDVFRADEPRRPYLAYGRSKAAAERRVTEIADATGLPSVILRAPWFYGPYQPVRQTTFLRLVRQGLFPLPAPATARRSMVYVDNLVQGALLAASHPKAVGETFWIADESPYEIGEIVAATRQALREAGLSVRRRTVRVPNAVGDLAERADRALQALGRHSPQLHVLGEITKTIACDISYSTEVIGYQPTINLPEGMRRSVRWCLSEGIAL